MLVEKMSALVIVAIIMTVLITLFPQYQKSIKDINNDISIAESSIDLSNSMSDVCVQNNTFLSTYNPKLACLSKGTCEYGSEGTFYLVDQDGNIKSSSTLDFSAYYNADLEYCDNCDTSIGLHKFYKLHTSYKLKCEAACGKEPVLDIEANFVPAAGTDDNDSEVTPLQPLKFSRKVTVKRVFKSCGEAYSNGNFASGLFYLDFDGPGGLCPAQFYCDMNLGNPRVLIANTSSTGYSEIPAIPPPIMPNSSGRVNDKYLLAMLSSTTTHKFTVDIEKTQQGDLTLNLSSSFGEKGVYQVNTDYCSKNNTNIVSAAFSSSSFWAFVSKSTHSSVGYSEEVGSDGKVPGFHCLSCTGLNADGVCGLGSGGCCKGSLAGKLWMNF